MALAADHRNAAAQELDDILDDGHTDARALNILRLLGILTREGLEELLLELLAHAIAIILHHELQQAIIAAMTGPALHDEGNMTAAGSVFHGIA